MALRPVPGSIEPTKSLMQSAFRMVAAGLSASQASAGTSSASAVPARQCGGYGGSGRSVACQSRKTAIGKPPAVEQAAQPVGLGDHPGDLGVGLRRRQRPGANCGKAILLVDDHQAAAPIGKRQRASRRRATPPAAAAPSLGLASHFVHHHLRFPSLTDGFAPGWDAMGAPAGRRKVDGSRGRSAASATLAQYTSADALSTPCGRKSTNTSQATARGSIPLSVSWRASSAVSRPRQSTSGASQRPTSTGWVFDARSSHQPSSVLTRTPSISCTVMPSTAAQAPPHLLDHRELPVVSAVDAQLRRVHHLRQGVQHIGNARAPMARQRPAVALRRRAHRRSRSSGGRRRCGRSSRRPAARRFPPAAS